MAQAEPSESTRVLVVDDEPKVLKIWRRVLPQPRYDAALFTDPRRALEHLESADVDVAVVDLCMPEIDGLTLLKTIKHRWPDVEVVMISGYAGVEDAVEAIKNSAYDFLSKPLDSKRAELVVRQAAELKLIQRRLKALEGERAEDDFLSRMVGRSPAIAKVIDLIQRVASTSATVLICGESGTGKELVAQALHENSPRRHVPLITLNCAALPEALLESELFGYVRGAFTGATKSRQGLFEAADGGSVFLDEIGNMSVATQVKLLRTLQDGEVRPVGSNHPIKVDVRILAATNADLVKKCQEKTFRTDLYYRLNVIRIDLPPLRERQEDIALLAYHFLQKHQRSFGKTPTEMTSTTLGRLTRYRWPGNVRELENAMERVAILSREGKRITPSDLPAAMSQDLTRREPGDGSLFAEAREKVIARFERAYLVEILQRHGGSVHAAAREAGMDRSNFKRLLRRHRLYPGKR
jgi:two-component system response regulator HydG